MSAETLPALLLAAFEEDAELLAWTHALPPSMQREIAGWVTQPKGPEARHRRANQMAERLLATMQAEGELPPVIARALRGAEDGWQRMTKSCRREYLLAVFGARSLGTRARCIGELAAACRQQRPPRRGTQPVARKAYPEWERCEDLLNKNLLPIEAIAAKLGLSEDEYEKRSPVSAKLSLKLLERAPAGGRLGSMILVTATTPTVSGEGKTVTSIGLVQGLEYIGKRAILSSREPSLGPVFGMKGGAAGGGRSQVEPAEKINLHFHGDFHAITSAHNLLAALIDAHLFHGNEIGLDPAAVTWPRALDMNDRALREIVLSVTAPDKRQRDSSNRRSGFLITAASEIMAILSLAEDREDLRRRLARIVVGATKAGEPVTADQLGATGPMMALLAEALEPNLVQTTEGTPATVHCGPFANIAHGTSSVVSQKIGLRVADYVVNETGFASDLGFEKYMDLVMPSSGIKPACAVLVTTVQSMRNQGEGELERGFANLDRHIAIVKSFGLPAVVAINRFPKDTEEELATLRAFCEERGAAFALSEAFAKGGEGAAALARKVVEVIDAQASPALTTTYSAEDTSEEKIAKVARGIYGADGVEFSEKAQAALKRFEGWGFGKLPVCIAKTQYSLSDDPKKMGAPRGWTLHVTDVALSAGAGFLVVISGAMMLMPGLPKTSRAMGIDVDSDGEIIGMS